MYICRAGDPGRAETTQSKYIVTAHTQTDRAKTILSNLIRGVGVDFLSALSWLRELTEKVDSIDPILEVNPSVAGQFCGDQQLPVGEDVYDRSNQAYSQLPALLPMRLLESSAVSIDRGRSLYTICGLTS